MLADLRGVWPELNWQVTSESQPHETGFLQIDSAKACSRLEWRPVWNYEESIKHTAAWYHKWLDSREVTSHAELAAYCADAADSGVVWVTS